MSLPRWASSLVVLIGAYVAIMVAAALLLPPSWDWSVWDWMSAQHAPAFDSDEIAIVDVPWDTDLAKDRGRVATFLNELVHRQSPAPAAVILDIEFKACDTYPEPCGEPMESARQALIAAIRSATNSASASLPVYALEQPQVGPDDMATGVDPHDPDIYAVLTGAAHTRFTADPRALFYRACYPVNVVEKDGSVETVSDWDMVVRVLMRAGEVAQATCDTSDYAVPLAADPVGAAQAAITKLSSRGTYAPDVEFGSKYVIVGTIEDDPGYDLGNGRRLPGPELLAWALNDALKPGTASNAHAEYDTEPQDEMLLVLVPGFSALTLSAFIAIFFLLKRMRLQALRRALPWLAAVASAGVGLAAFALFEWWLLLGDHIQPQVTLISLGVVLTSFLASLRAYQVLFAEQWGEKPLLRETYDYDVFISYAHEEGAWVSEHVFVPFRDARLRDGRKLNVFFDTESIRYGTAWQDKISNAIDGSRFIVPVYSEAYFKSNYCSFEIKRAHLNWIDAGSESRIVLPIMRGNPKILPTVRDIQATSIEQVPDVVEKIVAEIVERLSSLGEPKPATNAGPAPQ